MTNEANTVLAETVGPPEEDDGALRARVYALLGALLEDPPPAVRLAELGAVETDAPGTNPMGAGWCALADAARTCDPDTVVQEYNDLFIGLGRGELVPHASYYLTGFLNEKPLAELRTDLAAYGIARPPGVNEPEDHIALLCQTMALLAAGDPPVPLDEQQVFFARHMAPWAGRFFEDLAVAESAQFYRGVARLGAAFIEFDTRYLEMPA